MQLNWGMPILDILKVIENAIQIFLSLKLFENSDKYFSRKKGLPFFFPAHIQIYFNELLIFCTFWDCKSVLSIKTPHKILYNMV